MGVWSRAIGPSAVEVRMEEKVDEDKRVLSEKEERERDQPGELAEKEELV